MVFFLPPSFQPFIPSFLLFFLLCLPFLPSSLYFYLSLLFLLSFGPSHWSRSEWILLTMTKHPSCGRQCARHYERVKWHSLPGNLMEKADMFDNHNTHKCSGGWALHRFSLRDSDARIKKNGGTEYEYQFYSCPICSPDLLMWRWLGITKQIWVETPRILLQGT